MSMSRLKLNTLLALALVASGNGIPMMDRLSLEELPTNKPRYQPPKPHQGAKEMARRRKKMEMNDDYTKAI